MAGLLADLLRAVAQRLPGSQRYRLAPVPLVRMGNGSVLGGCFSPVAHPPRSGYAVDAKARSADPYPGWRDDLH